MYLDLLCQLYIYGVYTVCWLQNRAILCPRHHNVPIFLFQDERCMYFVQQRENKKKHSYIKTHDTSVSRFTSSWCILLVPQVPTGHRVNVVRLYGACYVSGCDFVRISCLAVGSPVAFLKLTHISSTINKLDFVRSPFVQLKQTSSEVARCQTKDHNPGAGGLQPGMRWPVIKRQRRGAGGRRG